MKKNLPQLFQHLKKIPAQIKLFVKVKSQFINANLSLTAVETEDANNVLPQFGSNDGSHPMDAVAKKFRNVPNTFALISYVDEKLPNSSTTATTQALGWRDGKAYVLELETEAD